MNVAAPLPRLAGLDWSETSWAGGTVYQLLLDGRVVGQLLRDGGAWLLVPLPSLPGDPSPLPLIADLRQAALELHRLLEERAARVAASLTRAAGGFSGCARRSWTE